VALVKRPGFGMGRFRQRLRPSVLRAVHGAKASGVVGACLLLFLFAETAAATDFQVRAENDPKSLATIWVSGTIPPDARERFVRVYRTLGLDERLPGEPRLFRRTLHVLLDSRGGDLSGAMDLGRFLRFRQALVSVRDDAVCASACVFTLMGGVTRLPLGRVGIHRPYPPDTKEARRDPVGLTKEYSKRITEYVREMGVSTEIVQQMERAAPYEVQWLNPDEEARLGLVGTDAAHSLLEDAYIAEKKGITLQEYYRRQGKIRSECWTQPDPTQRRECMDAISATGEWNPK
jgi:hypothetical protein